MSYTKGYGRMMPWKRSYEKKARSGSLQEKKNDW
jgi:hypothetical protein